MALLLRRGLHVVRYLRKVVIEECMDELKEWGSMPAHIYIVDIKRTKYRCSPNRLCL